MKRSSSRPCNSVAISVTAWRWWPDYRRPPLRHRPGNEATFMRIHATIPFGTRDVRLDLFRGLANWAIFLDHIPHEVLSSFTTRNYGFSDAADLFVFISGYTAALA